MLKEIAQICGCNMLEAKKIIEVTGFEFKPMDALETRALKKKLKGQESVILYLQSFGGNNGI